MRLSFLLERVDALGHLADQHVADPDGVGVLALQRTPVLDVAARLGGCVVDEQPVLEVLAGIGEVDAVQVDVAAGPPVVGRGAGADDVAAQGHGNVLEVGVAADLRVLGDDVHRVIGPVLNRDEGQLGAVVEDDFDVLGPGRRSVVVDDDDGLAERAGPDEQVAGGGVLRPPRPVRRIVVACSITASAGMVTSNTECAAAQARAETRSVGT